MEAGDFSNKDDLSTSTTTPHIPNAAKLTFENKKLENDIEDASLISDPLKSHQIDNSEQSVFQNDQFIVSNKKDVICTWKLIDKPNSLDENDSPSRKKSSLHVRYDHIESGTSCRAESRELSERSSLFRRFSMGVITAKKWKPAPLVEGVEDDKKFWSSARSGNRPALFVLWWSLLALIMYIVSIYDLIADCQVAYLFYHDQKTPHAFLWSIISITTLMLSYVIQCCFSFYEVTYAAPKEFGRLSKKRYSISLFLLMPWIVVLIGIYDTYKNQYTRRLETAYIMMFIETITETVSQCALQLNAICVYTHVKDSEVAVVQWYSVSTSLLFLSIGIAYSVIFYNNKNTTQGFKLLFCVFGGITTVSRLLLCSSWALVQIPLYTVPWMTGLLTTSLTWLVIRTFSCFGKHKNNLTKYNIYNLPMLIATLCSWVTSFIFNCFSPSGLPVSVLMCVLAGVDFYLKSGSTNQFDRTISIINISLTAFVLVCNILFSFIPICKNVKKAWIEGEGEDDDDPYHFIFY